jgi:hypothetical protein
MPRILVSASVPTSLLAGQTPGSSGNWEDFEFLFEPDDRSLDGWVVYDDLPQPQRQLYPTHNTLLITGEPPSLRRYRPRFTGQFAHLWTAQSGSAHRHVTQQNEAQHWHYAMGVSQAHGRPLARQLEAQPTALDQLTPQIASSQFGSATTESQTIVFGLKFVLLVHPLLEIQPCPSIAPTIR